MQIKKSLMYGDEYETYTALPENFIVYRGVTSGRNPNGMSWTREYDKAECSQIVLVKDMFWKER